MDKKHNLESEQPKTDFSKKENLNEIISQFISRRTPEAWHELAEFCSEKGLDYEVYRPYFEDGEWPEKEETIIMQKATFSNTPHVNKLIFAPQDILLPIPKTQYHEAFPYTRAMLRRLAEVDSGKHKFRTIRIIIGGFYSSYGSRALEEVLNVEENFIMKVGINFFKGSDFSNNLAFKEEIIRRYNSENPDEKINIHQAYGATVKYLNHYAYTTYNWGAIHKKLAIDEKFTTEKGDEQRRLNQIPEQDKIYFMNSLFNSPNITFDDLSNLENPYFDYRINSNNANHHIAALYDLLKRKWDNLDKKPESRKSSPG